jgi:hypothetical protein
LTEIGARDLSLAPAVAAQHDTEKDHEQRKAAMNPILISTFIAAASFILSIFSALYLSQRHVDKLMEQLDKRIIEQWNRFNDKIDGLKSEMNTRFDGVDQRLSNLEQRLTRVEDILFKPALPR